MLHNSIDTNSIHFNLNYPELRPTERRSWKSLSQVMASSPAPHQSQGPSRKDTIKELLDSCKLHYKATLRRPSLRILERQIDRAIQSYASDPQGRRGKLNPWTWHPPPDIDHLRAFEDTLESDEYTATVLNIESISLSDAAIDQAQNLDLISRFPSPAYWRFTVSIVDGTRKTVGEIAPKLLELDYKTPNRIDILGGRFKLPYSSRLPFNSRAQDWNGFVDRLQDHKIVIGLEIYDKTQTEYFAQLLQPVQSSASWDYGYANAHCGFDEKTAALIRPAKRQGIQYPSQAVLNIELSSAAIGSSILKMWNFTLRRALPTTGQSIEDSTEKMKVLYIVGEKEQKYEGCIFCRRNRFNNLRHLMFHIRLCCLTSSCRVECSLARGLHVVLKSRERVEECFPPDIGRFSAYFGTDSARLRALERDEPPGKYIRRDVELSDIAKALPKVRRKLAIPPPASLEMIRDEFTGELRVPRLVTSGSKRTIRTDEELSDSDEDPDMEFAHLESLNRLSKAHPCEREYIGLWNRHCDDERLGGDYFLVDSFVRFVEKHRERFLNADMYHHLRSHLRSETRQGSLDGRLSRNVLRMLPGCATSKRVPAKEARKPYQCICGQNYSVRVRMDFIECSAKVSPRLTGGRC
jgi:VEFS-Box of polycomb protein